MQQIIEKYLQIPSPLTRLSSPLLNQKEIHLFMKRDELIHRDVSGNKWRKLKYNIQKAKELNKDTLVSFGGNYSNHLVALAAAAKLFGFKSIGYVRGDTIDESTKTITSLRELHMELLPLSRTQFRDLENKNFISHLNQKHPNSYIIPLGGTNDLAMLGIQEMVTEIDQQVSNYQYITTSIGSGGTAAGIIKNTAAHTLVFNSFYKDFTSSLIEPLIGKSNNWTTIKDYHFGGFAKTSPVLLQFINEFKEEYHIQLDYVYNGKMMYGLMDMIRNDYFSKGDKIIAIHTGGLQGNVYL